MHTTVKGRQAQRRRDHRVRRKPPQTSKASSSRRRNALTSVYLKFILARLICSQIVSLNKLNSTKMTLDIFMPANCKLLLLLDI